jgi:hypothetical protein
MGFARRGFLLVAVLAALVGAPAASPSQLLDDNASDVRLAVNGKGEALVTYTANGRQKRVLAWGAVNASPPARGQKQVEFRLDYSGGYGKYRTTYWKTFGSTCLPYDGPPLAWRVTACKAPDGSYWALQAWQRKLKNYGVPSTGRTGGWELHLSHWTGALPVLTVTMDEASPASDRLFGSYTLNGGGIYGFGATTAGVPLDSFGRNVYVDTFDSAYGTGWARENSFLTHGPGGTFCYLFARHGSRPEGNGAQYRATVIGPGVMPDVMWTGPAPPRATAAERARTAAAIRALADPACRP